MKKLFFIMILALIGLVSYSQNETLDRELSYSETYFWYNGQSTDVLNTTDSTWTYTFRKLTNEKVFAHFYLSLDSTGGTANNVNIFFQYKVSPNEAFVDYDTVIYYGSADTTFKFETSSAVVSDYWRVYMIGADNTFLMSIDQLDAKLVY